MGTVDDEWGDEEGLNTYVLHHCRFFFYFQYELLICFHDDQDPAITLVQKLKKKYPKVDVKMFFRKCDNNCRRTKNFLFFSCSSSCLQFL